MIQLISIMFMLIGVYTTFKWFKRKLGGSTGTKLKDKIKDKLK